MNLHKWITISKQYYLILSRRIGDCSIVWRRGVIDYVTRVSIHCHTVGRRQWRASHNLNTIVDVICDAMASTGEAVPRINTPQ